ncbi:MAG: FHA domain-containing protein [Verrucomicrobiota bacterium]
MTSDVSDELQKLGQRRKTGCLQIIAKHSQDGTVINVFLKSGLIVYCESRAMFKTSVGLQNLAFCLKWPNPELKWINERPTPKIAYQHETQSILFRIASILANPRGQEQKIGQLLNSDQRNEDAYYDNPRAYGFSLHVLDTEFSGMQFFVLDDKSIIGRKNSSDFVIPHPTLSSEHCELHKEPSGYMVIQDLGSTNGTMVNDVLVQSSKLFDGDRITTGDISMMFCVRTKFDIMHQIDEQQNNFAKAQVNTGGIRSVNQSVKDVAKKSVVDETTQHSPIITIKQPQPSTSKVFLDEITKRVKFWKKKR